jgi:hypothetical protein
MLEILLILLLSLHDSVHWKTALDAYPGQKLLNEFMQEDVLITDTL